MSFSLKNEGTMGSMAPCKMGRLHFKHETLYSALLFGPPGAGYPSHRRQACASLGYAFGKKDEFGAETESTFFLGDC